ncbi:potassium channel family protein [Synechococcus sp. CBW1107]|uniref:potassium channel family protein n=1 Tax=Synechococcus sp. CBW1107 TaxID=2789857 RepID=UPI002AD3AAAC|nr:potassium channel family protein [Synechococcus sp. CBW1107]CAK6687850.1 hypothetical protein MNNICLKF_00300 [Synechococcus sp. CBW1107]
MTRPLPRPRRRSTTVALRVALAAVVALVVPLAQQASAATTTSSCTSPSAALQLLITAGMLMLTSLLQLGVTTLVAELNHHPQLLAWCAPRAYLRSLGVLVGAAVIALALLGDILLWALLFRGLELFSTLELSFYFSGITFTSVGYGDVMLPTCWRLLSVGLAVNGLLMAGWSTALLIFMVQRSMELRFQNHSKP